MNFTERVSQNAERFTAADQKIADFLVRKYPHSLLEKASALAETLDVNVSTVTRFFRKIGYGSIREANREVRDELPFLMHSPVKRSRQRKLPPDHALLQSIMDQDLANIRNTFNGITGRDINTWIDLLSDTQRSIYITGARKLHALSFYLYSQLNPVRQNVCMLGNDQNYLPELLMRVRSKDVLVVFNFRRYPKINSRLSEIFTCCGGDIVLITDSVMAPLCKSATVKFVVVTQGPAVFDSYTAAFSLINALLAKFVKASGTAVTERFAELERVSKYLDIYTWHD
jgi:DNA-binding MurR/RpiR family transcriptional regulator